MFLFFFVAFIHVKTTRNISTVDTIFRIFHKIIWGLTNPVRHHCQDVSTIVNLTKKNRNSADCKIDTTYKISINLQAFQVGQLGEYSFREFNYLVFWKTPRKDEVCN